MKVKLLVSRAGPHGVQNSGDTVEVSAAEAKRMIEAGQAVAVRAGPKPESTAANRKPETA